MEYWEGPCGSCDKGGGGALTLAYRGEPAGGLCAVCARDPARIRAFVEVAEAFRRGGEPDGSRGAVRVHRREGLREGMPLVLFTRLIPGELRASGQGRPLPPPALLAYGVPGRPAVAAIELSGVRDTTRAAGRGIWQWLRRVRWGG